MNQTSVTAAELRPDAGMVGAATMAMLELEGARADGRPAQVCPTPIGNLED